MNERYFWRSAKRGGQCGQAGEIPGIQVFTKEELPPIEKANMIRVHFLRDKVENSDLSIEWLTGDTSRVLIRAKCEANDQRLKMQYKENPGFAEKIIEMLVSYSKEKNLEVKEILPEACVPENLRQYVELVKKWEEFLKPLREENLLNSRYGSGVTSDGYYQYATEGYYLKAGAYPGEGGDVIFDFEQPPQVDEECVRWLLPDEKVEVILPHDSTNERVVDYYGYQEVYKQYLKRKEEKDQIDKESMKACEDRYNEQKKQTEEKLHQSFFEN